MNSSNALLTAIASEALELSLAASAASAIVLLIRRPVRALFGARVAYALWWLLPAAILAVLLPAPSLAPAAIELGRSGAAAGLPSVISADLPTTPWALTWLWPGLAALWLAGCTAALARMALQQHRFHRALGALERMRGNLWKAGTRHGLPAVVGLRARIVLPADFEHRYAPEQQALVLAHEQVHVRRGDVYWNFGFALLCALQWFNPLLRIAQRAYRLDQELACDACVLAMHPQSVRSYGEALLGSSSAFPAAPLGCPAFGTHPLKERITMLTRPLPSLNRRLSGFALSLALGVGFAGIAWSQQAPRPTNAELLDIQLELSVEGGPVQTPRVVTPAGQDFGLRIEAPDGESWSFDLVAERVQQDQFEVSGQIRRDGELAGQPSLRLRDGVPGRLTLEQPDGSSIYALGLTVQSGADIAPPPPPAPPAPPAASAPEAPSTPPNPAHLPIPPAPPVPPTTPAARPSTAASTRAAPAVAPAAPSAPAAAAAASPSYRSLSAPEYPAAAKAAGSEGTTLLRLGIDASGRVRTIDIEASSGDQALDRAASDAVELWTFNPATAGGRAIDSQIRVPVQFIAANSGAAPFVAPPGALDTIVLRADRAD